MEAMTPDPPLARGRGHSALEELRSFDRHADLAITYLIRYLDEKRDMIAMLARARFVEGYDLYPDRPLFSKSSWELLHETDEELADAVVYVARMLDL